MLIFHNIYALPLSLVYEIIFFTLVLWILLGVLVRKSVKLQRMWQLTNVVLFAVSVIGIVCFTLVSRNGDSADKSPFIRTFEMIKEQPELIREMVMNAFLFFPLGLTLPYTLSYKSYGSKRAKSGSLVDGSSEYSFKMKSDMSSEMLCEEKCENKEKGEKNEKQNDYAIKGCSEKRKNDCVVSVVFITIAVALVLSCTIESIQHFCNFGSPELSDIIMNTLGAAVGSLAFVVSFKVWCRYAENK